MNLALSRKRLQVCSVIGEESVQVMVEGTLEVLRQRPPVGRILDLEVLPKVKQVEASNGFIEVQGSIDASLLYVSEDETGRDAVYAFDAKDTLTFARTIDMPGVSDDMEVSVRIFLSDLEYERTSSSTVEIDAIVDIQVRAFKSEELRVVVDSAVERDLDIEVTKDVLHLTKNWDIPLKSVELEYVLNVPPDLPQAERVIKSCLTPRVSDAQILGDKILIRGSLTAEILYGADSEEGTDAIQTFTMDAGEFAWELELPEGPILENVKGAPKVRVLISQIRSEIVSDGEKVGIWAEATVMGQVREIKEIKVVTAIEAEGIAVESRQVLMDGILMEGSTRLTLEQVFEDEEEYSPIEKVIRCSVVPLMGIYKVIGGALHFEGNAKMTLSYLGAFEDGIVKGMTCMVPFEGNINIPGAEDGMGAVVDVRPERPVYHIIGENKIGVAIGLNVSAEVMSTEEGYVITDAVGVKPVNKSPGITIYMVQSGDTLWRISNRYGVEEQLLLLANGLSDGVDIQQGMKLIIPRC